MRFADGVPAEIVSTFERTADGSRLQVSLKYPHYLPVMRFCRVRSTRAALERAFNSRCLDVNSDILNQLVQLRQKVLLLFPQV